MKKPAFKNRSKKEEMKPEYDFAKMKGGTRGKYYNCGRAEGVDFTGDFVDALHVERAIGDRSG